MRATSPSLLLPLLSSGWRGATAFSPTFVSLSPARRPLATTMEWPSRRSHHTSSSRPSSLFALPPSTSDDDDDDDEMALSTIRRQLEEMTESLENARRREEGARIDNNLLRGRRDGTKVETEDVVVRLKRGFADEIDLLSDRIEGTQDEMRDETSRTRSLISTIRDEAAKRAVQLRSELSDLESRLGSLRREAAAAARGRNRSRRSVEDDVRRARSASMREIEGIRSEMAEEKRRLKLEKWEIESRIERAVADAVSAVERLREAEEEERAKAPLISDLREALSETTRRVSSQIEALKEGRKARGMFFDASFKRLREEKKNDINSAKAISEVEMSDEDAKLDGAVRYYESLLTETEERLQRIIETSNEPVELSGYDAIADAQRRMEALIRERDDAISRQEESRISALKEAAKSHEAIRDRYDAKYENEVRDLEGQRSRSNRKLDQEDRRRERRMVQLRGEMDELTLKLSTLMKDEREAAKLNYQELKKAKNAALAKSVSEYERTLDQIRSVRSDLIFVQDELNRLQDASQRNRLRVKDLENERSSFRKQVGRTMAIAIGRITRR